MSPNGSQTARQTPTPAVASFSFDFLRMRIYFGLFFAKIFEIERDAANTKQFELWQAATCDVRIKSWNVRESKLGVRDCRNGQLG